MGPVGHSPLGASSMTRWAACPGSVALAAKAPAGRTSLFAAEGTCAHEIAEECLLNGYKASRYRGTARVVDGFTIEVDTGMTDAVQVYLDAVRDTVKPWRGQFEMSVEKSFHLKQVDERLWGTNDCCVWFPAEKHLDVWDYKHGQGVPVEVTGNLQLRYYALGALLESGHGAETIEIHIAQPRCPHRDGPIRSEKIDVIDLIDWSADLLDAVKRVDAEPDTYAPGEKQCRWCPASAMCPALREQAQSAAKAEFTEGEPYDPALLAETLAQIPMIEAWCKSVQEFALAEALASRTPPGFKVVRKRGRRIWRDEKAAEAELIKYGCDRADLIKETFKTPAQIEKIVGKSNKGDIAHLIESVEGGETLAPADDPREEVRRDAASEFANT